MKYPIICLDRNTRGQGSLRELLNPLIKEVVEDKNLSINTNPVDVYKQWINQKEMDTGVPRFVQLTESEYSYESNPTLSPPPGYGTSFVYIYHPTMDGSLRLILPVGFG